MSYFSNRTKLIAGSLGILAFGIIVFSYFTYLQISSLIHEEENVYIQKPWKSGITGLSIIFLWLPH